MDILGVLWSNYFESEIKNEVNFDLTSGNLQSYLSTTRLVKLTVVFEYCKAKETYSRILLEPVITSRKESAGIISKDINLREMKNIEKINLTKETKPGTKIRLYVSLGLLVLKYDSKFP